MIYCALASGGFDFVDGMAARLLHVKSSIGKELDSLADMVSFGFLPGTVLYLMLEESSSSHFLPYTGFVVTVFSALRLAKFNVDTRQTTDFIGLNTPMNTFFIISLPYIAAEVAWVKNPLVLLATVALSSFLLISEVKLFSMKLSSLSWRENKFKYLFLIASLASLLIGGLLALPGILLLYIIFSKLHFWSETSA